MNKEIYRILKEINSLHHKVLQLRETIKAEQERVSKIETRVKQTKEELEDLLAQLKQKRQELTHNEGKLEQAIQLLEKTEIAIASAQTEKELDSLNKQKLAAETTIDELNETTFNQLEEVDELNEKREELQGFIKGAPEGVVEIQADVDEQNKPRLIQVEQYLQRIKDHFQELPTDISLKMKKALELPKSAVTKLNSQNYCDYCGSQAAPNLARDIETKLLLKSCSGCSRLIIPLSSQYL